MYNFLVLDEVIKDPRMLDDFISNIFRYVIYFYPGIITVYLLSFFNGYSQKQNKALIIKSVSFSYVYNLILCQFLNFDNDAIKYNILLIAISIIFPYILYMVLQSNFLEILCDKLKINTSIKDCDIDILKDDDEEYTYVRIFLRNRPIVYEGFLETHEREYDRKRYVIICGYSVAYVKEDYKEKTIKEYKDTDCNEKCLIFLDDIERIEKCSEKRIKCEKFCENKQFKEN